MPPVPAVAPRVQPGEGGGEKRRVKNSPRQCGLPPEVGRRKTHKPLPRGTGRKLGNPRHIPTSNRTASRILQHPAIPVLKHTSTALFQHPAIPVLKYTSTAPFQHPAIPSICKLLQCSIRQRVEAYINCSISTFGNTVLEVHVNCSIEASGNTSVEVHINFSIAAFGNDTTTVLKHM